MKGNPTTLIAVFFAVLLCVSCQGRREDSPPASEPQTAETGEANGPLVLHTLRNMTYAGFEEPLVPVTLVDGHWEGAPFAPGGASRPTVDFVGSFVRSGNLDGDAADEAVVLLGQSSGGSGHLIYMAAVAVRDGQAENVATTLLGDRIQVRSARIEDRHIILDIVKAGKDDAMCCPGDLEIWGYALSDGNLKRVLSEDAGRLTLESLRGIDWVLRRWDRDQSAPDEPEITLAFDEGRFVGNSGCNRYSAGVTEGGSPGEISVQAAAATRMACPDPMMAAENRFLSLLGATSKFGFMAGALALSYEKGGAVGVMLLEPRTPAGRGIREP